MPFELNEIILDKLIQKEQYSGELYQQISCHLNETLDIYKNWIDEFPEEIKDLSSNIMVVLNSFNECLLSLTYHFRAVKPKDQQISTESESLKPDPIIQLKTTLRNAFNGRFKTLQKLAQGLQLISEYGIDMSKRIDVHHVYESNQDYKENQGTKLMLSEFQNTFRSLLISRQRHKGNGAISTKILRKEPVKEQEDLHENLGHLEISKESSVSASESREKRPPFAFQDHRLRDLDIRKTNVISSEDSHSQSIISKNMSSPPNNSILKMAISNQSMRTDNSKNKSSPNISSRNTSLRMMKMTNKEGSNEQDDYSVNLPSSAQSSFGQINYYSPSMSKGGKTASPELIRTSPNNLSFRNLKIEDPQSVNVLNDYSNSNTFDQHDNPHKSHHSVDQDTIKEFVCINSNNVTSADPKTIKKEFAELGGGIKDELDEFQINYAISIEPHEQMIAVETYEPMRPDELKIKPGDVIEITALYDDNWSVGSNLITKLSGFFPLRVVEKMKSEEVQSDAPTERSSVVDHGIYDRSQEEFDSQEIKTFKDNQYEKNPLPPHDFKVAIPTRTAASIAGVSRIRADERKGTPYSAPTSSPQLEYEEIQDKEDLIGIKLTQEEVVSSMSNPSPKTSYSNPLHKRLIAKNISQRQSSMKVYRSKSLKKDTKPSSQEHQPSEPVKLRNDFSVAGPGPIIESYFSPAEHMLSKIRMQNRSAPGSTISLSSRKKDVVFKEPPQHLPNPIQTDSSLSHLDKLLAAGKITENEYIEIVKKSNS